MSSEPRDIHENTPKERGSASLAGAYLPFLSLCAEAVSEDEPRVVLIDLVTELMAFRGISLANREETVKRRFSFTLAYVQE